MISQTIESTYPRRIEGQFQVVSPQLKLMFPHTSWMPGYWKTL